MARQGTVWGALAGLFVGGPVGAVVGGLIGRKVQSELEAQAEQRREKHALALADMRSAIAAAITDEDRSGRTIACLLRKDSPLRRSKERSHANAQAKFIRSYVQETPDLLEALEVAAERTGLAPQVLPVLNAAEGYFFDTSDELPNDQGLVGLLDDAYLARSLIDEVNQKIRQERGEPLLDIGLASANRSAGYILPNDVKARLDSRISETMDSPDLRQSLPALLEAGASIFKAAGPLLVLGAQLRGQSFAPREPTYVESIAAREGIDLNSPW